jgi:hypothetical protein
VDVDRHPEFGAGALGESEVVEVRVREHDRLDVGRGSTELGQG